MIKKLPIIIFAFVIILLSAITFEFITTQNGCNQKLISHTDYDFLLH